MDDVQRDSVWEAMLGALQDINGSTETTVSLLERIIGQNNKIIERLDKIYDATPVD